MRVTAFKCDKCGGKYEGETGQSGQTFSVPVGREMDAAGSTDTIHAEVDLCRKCCYVELQTAMLRIPMANGEREQYMKGLKKCRA